MLIAAVATILPAVAVADVMITGNVSVVGTQNTNVVMQFQPGPNYLKAFQTGSIVWTPNTGSAENTAMGQIDLEGITNESTYMVNVIDFNVTLASGMSGLVYVNYTGSGFPAGAGVYVSQTQVTLGTAPSLTYISLNQASPTTLMSYAVSSGNSPNTLYFSFYLPPGTYNPTPAPTGTITAAFMTN